MAQDPNTTFCALRQLWRTFNLVKKWDTSCAKVLTTLVEMNRHGYVRMNIARISLGSACKRIKSNVLLNIVPPFLDIGGFSALNANINKPVINSIMS